MCASIWNEARVFDPLPRGWWDFVGLRRALEIDVCRLGRPPDAFKDHSTDADLADVVREVGQEVELFGC